MNFNLIKSLVVTEKSLKLQQKYKYTFLVRKEANKRSLRDVINSLFGGANVLKINILTKPAKTKVFKGIVGTRKKTKKAVVLTQKKLELEQKRNVNHKI